MPGVAWGRSKESPISSVSTAPSRRQAATPARPVSLIARLGAPLPVRLASLVVAVAALVAHLPGMTQGGFVWDDKILLWDNPLVKAPDGLRRFWLTTQAPDYLPVTWSTLWIEYRLYGGKDAPYEAFSPSNPNAAEDKTHGGQRATGYHITNTLMHAGGAVLLMILLRSLGVPGAFWAALLFAVHPVTVASVAWISERKNTLSILFYLTSLLGFVHFARDGRRGWYALSLAAFALALLSKTSVVMLPFVLWLLLWWMGKLDVPGGLRQWARTAWPWLLRTAPYFLLSLGAGIATIWFQEHNVIVDTPVPDRSWPERIVNAGWIPWFYLYKAWLPLKVTMMYERWSLSGASWVSWLPAAALVAVLAGALAGRRWIGRGVFIALAYFVLTLLPVMGFVRMFFHRYTLVSDHLQYLSMPGVIALAVGLVSAALSRWGPSLRRTPVLAGALLAAVLTVATAHQSLAYRGLEDMWLDVIAKSPGCAPAYYNVAVDHIDRHQIVEAVLLITKAIEMDPDYSEAYNNLGQILGSRGGHGLALRLFRRALECNMANRNALQNLVISISTLPPEHIRPGMEFAMGMVWTHPIQLCNFAALTVEGLPEVHDPPLALRAAQRAVELTSRQNPACLDTLAGTYAHNGDWATAATVQQEALKVLTDGNAKSHKSAAEYRQKLNNFRVAAMRNAPAPQPQPATMPTLH